MIGAKFRRRHHDHRDLKCWPPMDGVGIVVGMAAHRVLTTTPGDPGVPR
jgi:hypothetical protein